MRHRCGAPIQTRDKLHQGTTCRVFVSAEGERCRHHKNSSGLPAWDKLMKGMFD